MIAILVCDQDKNESAMFLQNCRKQVGLNSDEALHIETAADERAFFEAVEKEKLIDLLYYEFRKGQKTGGLRSFRQRYSDTMALYITDPSVSPMEYLRPGIAPDSLLLRPLTAQQLASVNAEFMGSFFERFESRDTESCFVVETREEKVFIPFSHIYYFEARNKKLFVRVQNEEYAFYDTIEALEKRLPENFQRCHRSYIVNTNKIVRIFLADNYMELGNQIGVPISRSYRSFFKGART